MKNLATGLQLLCVQRQDALNYIEENLGTVCASLVTLRPLSSKSIRNQSKKRTAGATPNYTFGFGQAPLSNSFMWKMLRNQSLFSRNDEDKEYLNSKLGPVTQPELAVGHRYRSDKGEGYDITEASASVGRESAHAIV